jgi:hypothetical protein
MRAVADQQPHQLVPGRMEFHLVDAMAFAVVMQAGGVQVGEARQVQRLRLAQLGTERGSAAAASPRLPPQGLLQAGSAANRLIFANGATVLRTSWVSKGCILSPFKLLFFILLNNTL